MKYHVTFQPYMTTFGPRLLLNGRGEVHLSETALIAEGNLAKFAIPLVMSFYQRMLSEWTTRTVPYARIQRYRYSGY